MAHRFALMAAMLVMAAPALAGFGVPTGWHVAGTRPARYVFGTEPVPGAIGKESAYIQAAPGADTQGSPGDFGTLMQTIKADDYIGQRLRLSIRLKSDSALAVRMFFRVDGSDGKPAQFANTEKSPLTGTTGWRQVDLVLDVPPGSATINYGFSLAGYAGKGWADAVSLTPVDKSVPSSDMLANRTMSARPVNMGFDP